MTAISFESSAADRARRLARTRFTRFDDVAVAVPGGMFAHVVGGRVVGFGVEPVGDAIVDASDRLDVDGARGRVLWGRVAATVASVAAATAAGAATAAVAFTKFRRTRPSPS